MKLQIKYSGVFISINKMSPTYKVLIVKKNINKRKPKEYALVILSSIM